MNALQRVLTSQGWPSGYADTLPKQTTDKLLTCIDVNSGALVAGVREKVAKIMREHFESQKAVVDPPGELTDG